MTMTHTLTCRIELSNNYLTAIEHDDLDFTIRTLTAVHATKVNGKWSYSYAIEVDTKSVNPGWETAPVTLTRAERDMTRDDLVTIMMMSDSDKLSDHICALVG